MKNAATAATRQGLRRRMRSLYSQILALATTTPRPRTWREESAIIQALIAAEAEFLHCKEQWAASCQDNPEPLNIPVRVYHGTSHTYPWPEIRGRQEPAEYWTQGLYLTPLPAFAAEYALQTRQGAHPINPPRVISGSLNIAALDWSGWQPESLERHKHLAGQLYQNRPTADLGPIIAPYKSRHWSYILPSRQAPAEFQPLGELPPAAIAALAAQRRRGKIETKYQELILS